MTGWFRILFAFAGLTLGTAVSGTEAPEILFRDRPAILVPVDGAPKFEAIKGSPYQRVANAGFPLIYDPMSGEYWLLVGEVWFTARQMANGRWTANAPPAGVVRLFPDSDAPEADAPDSGATDELRTTEIIVATAPTELVAVDGAPRYASLVGEEILYVANTGNDLFLEVDTRQHYLLSSGEWYRSSALEGPWVSVAAGELPEAFARIPKESEKAAVLAHVPGTEEFENAERAAQRPPTSTKYAFADDHEPEVVYMGYPAYSSYYPPAYYPSYPFFTSFVWSSGHYYRPWAGYYPAPYGWGYSRGYWNGYYRGHSSGSQPGGKYYRDDRKDFRSSSPNRTQIGRLPGIGGRPSARAPAVERMPPPGSARRGATRQGPPPVRVAPPPRPPSGAGRSISRWQSPRNASR